MIELKVTFAKTAELIPDPDNARTHSQRNIEAIKRSIQRFGIRKPIVAKEDTKVVYAGNATLEAALQLGIEKIPVAWIPKETSETVCRAYAIADNRTSELANWDTEKLENIIAELEDIDLEDLGFTEGELNFDFVQDLNYDEIWQGMPDFIQEDKEGFHQVIVHFETEQDMNNFAELVQQKITIKTKYIWHPKQKEIPAGRIENEP
jgi:ParB-like chromosome segregation protein Spo0J